MPFVCHLYPGYILSIKQLCQALHIIVEKHQSLRTSLIFDKENKLLMQRIIDLNDNKNRLFQLIESTFENNEQLNEIIHNEKRNCKLFNIIEGFVFRCHIIYYKEVSSNNILCDKDVLIFNFHQSLFDNPSMKIFLQDLNQAYTTNQLTYDNNTILRYVDCKYKYFFCSFLSSYLYI
jgi:hypothetical protein